MKIPINPLLFTPLVSKLFELWASTLRFEIVHGNFPEIIKKNTEGESFVIALWHGELFLVASLGLTHGDKFVVVVSQSKDGEFITQVLENVNIKTVRGSSSRGGVKALLLAAKKMKKENLMSVFTVDGPRGPRHKAKDGVIFMAQKAGAKIIPVRIFPKWKKIFKSWDQFVLPLPFSQCTVFIGEPMEVTKEKLTSEILTQEKKRLEKHLLELKQ